MEVVCMENNRGRSRKKNVVKGKREGGSITKNEKEQILSDGTDAKEKDKTQILCEIYTECRTLSRIMEKMARVYCNTNDNKVEVNN